MALIKCNECGKEISDTAKRCVNCGAKITKNTQQENNKKIYIIIGVIILVIILIFIISKINPNEKEKTIQQEYDAVRYANQVVEVIDDYMMANLSEDETIEKLNVLYQSLKSEYEIFNNEENGFSISLYISGIYINISSIKMDILKNPPNLQEIKEKKEEIKEKIVILERYLEEYYSEKNI